MGSSSKIIENDKRSYIEIVKETVKKEDCKSLKENMQKSEMKKHEEDQCAWKESPRSHNNDLTRHTPSRRPPMPRYQSIFLGLCYACNNYGHKAIDCRAYA